MISKKIGIVESIVDQNGELDDIRVKINGELQRPITILRLQDI